MRPFRLAAVLVLTLTLLGCNRAIEPSETVLPSVYVPPPPDRGDVGRFLNCTAEPRRALSQRELCEVAAFRARCTALDDCYVSCISSPMGVFSGGGCGHVCTFGLHPGAPHPDGVDACKAVPGDSGL